MLSVAVVGSGPSGVYTAEALLRQRPEAVRIDVYDRLPCPYGLVRYGVAPDHLKIKSIARALHKVLADPAVRFFGAVELGTALFVEDLTANYDAVVYAFGAAFDRRLGIPGEDLPGSFSAVDFVAWYCGHPDAADDQFSLGSDSVVVIGAGNVAVDVARILAKSAADLAHTDLPDDVLAVLGASKVRDIHIVARRGPAQAKFTTKELRELGEIADVDVVVDPLSLQLDAPSQAVVGAQTAIARNVDVLREFSSRPLTGKQRRLHLHFLLAPVAIEGTERVEAVRFERTSLDAAGNAVGTGELMSLPAGMVLRSVGYRGGSPPGVPLDERAGIIPNVSGRVHRDGQPAPGEYAVGWIKRGPTGVIGTNRSDAGETVAALLGDLADRPCVDHDPAAVPALLAERGVRPVHWDGWLAIEAAELAAGTQQGRERVKLTRWAQLREAAGGNPHPTRGGSAARGSTGTTAAPPL